MVIFRASIFEHRFRVGLQQKEGGHFWMNPHPKMASGFGFTHVMGGNELELKARRKQS